MFRETLLESASSRRKRNRWPMIMAFTAEIVVGALLVMLPLLSTGVISVSAHAPALVSMSRPNQPAVHHSSSGGVTATRDAVVLRITTTCIGGCLVDHRLAPTSDDSPAGPPDIGPMKDGIPGLPFGGPTLPPHLEPPREKRPVVVSDFSEGHLITRVDPVYPRIAVITGTQGEVRLHAIIAKDGSIRSLSVEKGVPMLAEAAMAAVKQWRYKPYILNGEPVEVDTFITVNFKKTND
jgi:protein TonB